MEAGHAHIDTGDRTEGVMFDDHAEDGLADGGGWGGLVGEFDGESCAEGEAILGGGIEGEEASGSDARGGPGWAERGEGEIGGSGLGEAEVMGDGVGGGAEEGEAALMEDDGFGAEIGDGGHLVADEEDRAAAIFGDIVHFAEALFLELGIADGEDFIDNEDIGIEVSGHGEGEADIHAAGVAFDRGIEEFFDFGELDDFGEFGFNFGARHAEDGAIEEDVFATREFGVEAGTDLEETGDAAFDFDVARGGFGDAAEDFEESAFAGAVAADDADDFAWLDIEGEIFEGPEFFAGGFFLEGAIFPGADGVEEGGFEAMAEAVVGGDLVPEEIAFGEIFDLDGWERHGEGVR